MTKFKDIPIEGSEYKIWVFNDDVGYRYQLYKNEKPVKEVPSISFTYEEAEDMNMDSIFQNKCDDLVHDFFSDLLEDELDDFEVEIV
jgi:hypothetical protein